MLIRGSAVDSNHTLT